MRYVLLDSDGHTIDYRYEFNDKDLAELNVPYAACAIAYGEDSPYGDDKEIEWIPADDDDPDNSDLCADIKILLLDRAKESYDKYWVRVRKIRKVSYDYQTDYTDKVMPDGSLEPYALDHHSPQEAP